MGHPIDLERELAASLAALTDAQHEDLVQAGVDRIDIALGLVGVAYGHVASERFEPHPDGRLAFVSPVRVHYPLCLETPVPEHAVRVGDVVDLVYWSLGKPRRWAVRTGVADVLGLIAPQYAGPDPVAVHRGPLGWLRNGCAGLVLLTPRPREVYRILSQCAAGIVAEDERHAEELRAVLALPWPRPSVFVRERRHAL